jgi:hypothetical protein
VVWQKLANMSEVTAASIIRVIIALMMEAACTSETLVNFYQTTQCNNPEDSHLQSKFGYYNFRFQITTEIILNSC